MATTEVGGSGSSSSSSLGGSANEGGGGSGARGRYVLKKGPWTEAEDAELLNYVKRHGEGNWNVVHKNSGLRRCGKSCRLRWANHLRPNLKKGPLSPEEEEIIIKLHAKYGNKWARMASQLDGRTDNEIKNYWNTKLKKSQRTGLPLYPVQTQQEQTPATSISPSSSLTSIFSASASSSFQQMQQHHPQNTDTYTNNPLPISPLNYPPYRNNIVTTTRKPFSFFSRRYNPSFSFPNIATSPIPFFHQSLSAYSLPILDALSLNTGPSMPAMRVTSFDPLSVFILNTSTTGISSIGKQPLVPPPSTAQTSSGNTGSEGGILGGASSSTTEYDHTEAGNSGLLEDLLEQSRTIARLEKLNKDIVREDNELLDQNSLYDFNVGLGHGNPNPEVYLRDSMPTHSDIGMTEKNEILQADMNVLDDDLMRLLECPSPVPIPDWYDDVVATTNYSNGQLPTNVEANVENNK